MDEKTLLSRITTNPAIFGGKPIIRGRRLAVEHVAGDACGRRHIRNDPRGLPLARAGGYPGVPGLRSPAGGSRAGRATRARNHPMKLSELEAGALVTAEPGIVRIRLPDPANGSKSP
jgi:hypothetical protein